MLKKANSEFDGVKVHTVQLPAIRAHRLFWRLGKVAPYVMAHVDTSKMHLDEIGGMVPALLELFGRLTVDESESLMKEILCATSATITDEQGAEKVVPLESNAMFDLVFSGKLGALYSTVAFVLVVNFGDFIAGALGASQPDAPEKATPESH